MRASLVAILVLAACNWTGVKGSGTPRSEVRSVGAFTAVDISGSIDAEIAIGGESRIEITGDDNLVPLVVTELDGHRLRIRTTKNVRPSLPLKARIATARLGELEVSGSSDVVFHGAHEDKLTLSLSGSTKVRGDGTAHELDIDAAGSCDVELGQLAAERAKISISGSGDAVVAVSQALDVSISGSGSVTYRGEPAITKHISGSGEIKKQ